MERAAIQLYGNMLAGNPARRQRLNRYVQLDGRITAAWDRLTAGTYTVREFLQAMGYAASDVEDGKR